MKLLRFILACCFLAVITLGQAPIQRQPFTTNINTANVIWNGTVTMTYLETPQAYNGVLTVTNQMTAASVTIGGTNVLTELDGKQATNVVATLALLGTFEGPATAVWVSDVNTGGLFVLDTTGLTPDGVLIVEAAGLGSGVTNWVRQYTGAAKVGWFGAVGDGTTDDRAALAAAITFGDAEHVPVEFTEGKNYRVLQNDTNSYALTATNFVDVIGNGAKISFERQSATNYIANLFFLDKSSADVPAFARFSNLHVDMGDSIADLSTNVTWNGGMGYGGSGAITTENNTDGWDVLVVESCTFTNLLNKALSLTGTVKTDVRNCYFNGPDMHGGCAAIYTSGSSLYLENNTYDMLISGDTSGQVAAHTHYLDNTSFVQSVNETIKDSEDCLMLDSVRNGSFVNTYFYDTSDITDVMYNTTIKTVPFVNKIAINAASHITFDSVTFRDVCSSRLFYLGAAMPTAYVVIDKCRVVDWDDTVQYNEGGNNREPVELIRAEGYTGKLVMQSSVIDTTADYCYTDRVDTFAANIVFRDNVFYENTRLFCVSKNASWTSRISNNQMLGGAAALGYMLAGGGSANFDHYTNSHPSILQADTSFRAHANTSWATTMGGVITTTSEPTGTYDDYEDGLLWYDSDDNTMHVASNGRWLPTLGSALDTLTYATNSLNPATVQLLTVMAATNSSLAGLYRTTLSYVASTNEFEVGSATDSLGYEDTEVIISTNGTGTTVGVKLTGVMDIGTEYVETFWAKANEVASLAQGGSFRGSMLWLTDTNLSTAWQQYGVRFTALGNDLYVQRACVDATDTLYVSNHVIWPSYAFPDNIHSFTSIVDQAYSYAKVQIEPVAVTNLISAAGDDIDRVGDVVVLIPTASYTLTSTPTIKAGAVLGQRITLLCTNESGYTVTLQDTNTLAGTTLKLKGPTRTLTTNVTSTLVWDGTSWIETETSDTNDMYFASVTVGGTNLVSAIGDISSTTNNWVLKTGDTMTGTLALPDLWVTNSTVTSYYHIPPTNWIDSMVPGMAFRNGSPAPSLENGPSAAIQLLAFAKDADNLAHGTLQLNHDYKEGTDIEPHIHVWFPADAASTAETNVWQITYMWGNIATNGFVGTPTTVIVTNSGQVYAGEHRVIAFPTITGTGKTISSVLMVTVQRTGTDGYDVYDDYIGFLGYDAHYQIDTPGSSSEWGK